MNIGIVIPSLGNSQLTLFTVGQCHYLRQFTEHESFIFTEDFEPPCMSVQTACMNISEMYSFTGILIATSLLNASMIMKINSDCKKIFYVWDLEFLRAGKNNFFSNNSVYRSPELKIVCRSPEHASALENYSNRKPDAIIQNINLMEICNEFSGN